MNLAENLSKTAAEHPEVVAIKLDDTELAYYGALRRGAVRI